MANLTQFLGLTATTGASSLTVFPADRGDSVSNGGRCCAYTIGGTTTKVHVEVWAGGGDGGGACCCMWPVTMPAPGQYVTKTFAVSSGDVLTICAAGSGCCSQPCCGNQGFPSFVNRNGTTCAYAYGGGGGCVNCWYKNFNCTGVCHPGCLQACAGTGDFIGCTYTGMSVAHNFCATGNFETSAGSPKYSQNMRLGETNCSASWTNNGCCRGVNHWPGGGGYGASACGGGCCWGSWGAGGLVVLTFYG